MKTERKYLDKFEMSLLEKYGLNKYGKKYTEILWKKQSEFGYIDEI